MQTTIIVDLTQSQIDEIEPIMEQAREGADNGNPGMVVAQIFGNHMRIGYLIGEKADVIAHRLNGVVQRTRSAYD